MFPDRVHEEGEIFREEWYRSRGYPLTVSWDGLPQEQKDEWVQQAREFNAGIGQEDVE